MCDFAKNIRMKSYGEKYPSVRLCGNGIAVKGIYRHNF